MQCTGCSYPRSSLVWIRHDDNNLTTTRRRECLRCGSRFTTHEKLKEPRRPQDEIPHSQGKT